MRKDLESTGTVSQDVKAAGVMIITCQFVTVHSHSGKDAARSLGDLPEVLLLARGGAGPAV